MNIYQWIALLVSLARGTVSKSTTIDHAGVARLKYAQKFTYLADPEVGYEPYWVNGDVLIHDETAETYGGDVETTKSADTMTPEPTETEKPMPMVCGEECYENYRSIKHVCAHDTGNNKMSGCWKHPFEQNPLGQNLQNVHCWNIQPDVFVEPFHEFDTYCEFLEATCREHFSSPRYVLLHIGKCQTEQFWFKDLISFTDVFSRLSKYPLLDLSTPYYKKHATANPLHSLVTKAT